MALDIFFQHQTLTGALILTAIAADSSLSILNLSLLSTGTYKFPYPLFTAFVQCLSTLVLVIFSEGLCCLFLRYWNPRARLITATTGQATPILDDEGGLPGHSTQCNESLIHPGDCQLNIFRRWPYLNALPIGIFYAAKVFAGSFILANRPFYSFILFRLSAIPCIILLHLGRTVSRIAGWSSLLATALLILPLLRFVPAHPSFAWALQDICLGFLFSWGDWLSRSVTLADCNSLLGSSGIASLVIASSEKYATNNNTGSWRFGRVLEILKLLRQAFVYSTASLAIVVTASGELRHIQRNCYVLDVSGVWYRLIASGILTGTALILLPILAVETSRVTSAMVSAPSSLAQIMAFNFKRLTFQGSMVPILCIFLTLPLLWSHSRGNVSLPVPTTRSNRSVIRQLVAGMTVTISVLFILHGVASRTPVSVPRCVDRLDANSTATGSHPLLAVSSRHDSYLGQRHQADAVADIGQIVDECGQIANGTGVDDMVSCLSFLATKEQEYLYPSNHQVESRGQGVQQVHDITTSYRPTSETPSSVLPGAICPGPVIPFHVYWTGPATWRLELFVKAYLYTQNLPCSRLWIWLDSEREPNAVNRMLCSDPEFARFRPLVQNGALTLKPWNFPRRVPVPAQSLNTSEFYTKPSQTWHENETLVADNIILDTDTNDYYILTSPNLALSPVRISDAVRFIILHLHGGLYCDMDILLLRDMRPLLLPHPITSQPRPFAEQWVERCAPGDYNTAVISLPANSSISTYLLHGGVRMGMNFHPRVIGHMALQDRRSGELAMLHNAVFDPLVTDLRRPGEGACTVPCHKNWHSAFMRVVDAPEMEWKAYAGVPVHDVEEMWPPTNRTLSTFFRGAWAYHVHNQWSKVPEPTSWMDVVVQAQDGFFTGERTNAYGEWWQGPMLEGYNRDEW